MSGRDPGAKKKHLGANKLHSGLIWTKNCSDLGHSKRLLFYPCNYPLPPSSVHLENPHPTPVNLLTKASYTKVPLFQPLAGFLAWAPFFKCLNLSKNFRSCGKWTYNNEDLEWPLSNIRTCLMNPYYKLYIYFLGPKIVTEIETLRAKLKKGAGATLKVVTESWSKECSKCSLYTGLDLDSHLSFTTKFLRLHDCV